jgi:hypothetical protein
VSLLTLLSNSGVVQAFGGSVTPSTFAQWLAATNDGAGPTRYWPMSETSGSTLTASIGGITGTYQNAADLELNITDAQSDKWVGFGGAQSSPGHATIATPLQSAAFTAMLLVQFDLVKAKHVLLTTAGSTAGHFSVEVVDDGAGGLKPRVWSRDSSGAAVIYVGTSTGTIPVGSACALFYVRRGNGTQEVWCVTADGAVSQISLTLNSGTPPGNWTAHPGSTWYVGTWPGSDPLDGVARSLALWDVALFAGDINALGSISPKIQNVVWARDIDAGEVQINTTSADILIGKAHPASGFTPSIITQGSLGTYAINGEALRYTAGSSPGLDTLGEYRISRNSANSPTQSLTITVTSGPPPPQSGLAEDERLPAATATLNATPANFDSVYASAQPGNHIVLANGSYGAKILSRDFPINNRLVIRSANLHGATFSGTVNDGDSQAGSGPATLIITGDGHILSGLNIDNGTTFPYNVTQIKNAASVRVTRCIIHGGQILSHLMPGAVDTLFDHNHFDSYSFRCVEWEDSTGLTTAAPPSNILRPIYARNWFTNGVGSGLLSCFATGNNHVSRQFYNGIIRFNYCGPGLSANDWVHNKGSGTIFAFNRFEAGGTNFIHNRFGLHVKFYGNYSPGHNYALYDGYNDAFGNFGSTANGGGLRCRGGNSKRYDDTRTAITWAGGTPGEQVSIFYSLRRSRIAGNNCAITIGYHDESFCSHSPQPCGRLNDGSFGFIADDPDDPRNGVHIYDNNQAPTFVANSCIQWYVPSLIFNNWQQQAPASWAAELPSWVTSLVDPTKRSNTPWGIAQNLTRGDAANPNTGPFRNSPGGLP